MNSNSSNYSHQSIASLVSKDGIGGYYILDEVKCRNTQSGKPFHSGRISDASGRMDFVMWDNCAFTVEDTGRIIYVDGSVDTYRGALQAKLLHAYVAPEDERKSLDMNELIPYAPIHIDNTFWAIKVALLPGYDTPYGKVAMELVKEHERELKVCPAAMTVHHAFVGGWAMHTRNMLKMAESVCDQYGALYPIDRKLLCAGVALHDIGKLREYVLSDYGLVKEYSAEGKLLGHSALGAMMVAEKAKDLGVPRAEVMALEHMLLSHHGKAELGAAVEPMCIEAQILTYLDGLDSRLEICRDALKKVQSGEFSDMFRALNKQIYRVA